MLFELEQKSAMLWTSNHVLGKGALGEQSGRPESKGKCQHPTERDPREEKGKVIAERWADPTGPPSSTCMEYSRKEKYFIS